MTEQLWSAVDRYITETLLGDDAGLEETLRVTAASGLPAINVSPPQGKQLHLLARMIGARAILEIGTLAGYSAIWMARALPAGGRLVTLEVDAKHAAVARDNIARAGLSDRAEVIVGRALDTLPSLKGPFDFFFIDADKASIPEYFQWALRLSRSGSVIIVDNVVRGGAVIDEGGDAAVQGVRRLNEVLSAEKRVSATTIQTVGSKGYDGFTMALVG